MKVKGAVQKRKERRKKIENAFFVLILLIVLYGCVLVIVQARTALAQHEQDALTLYSGEYTVTEKRPGFSTRRNRRYAFQLGNGDTVTIYPRHIDGEQELLDAQEAGEPIALTFRYCPDSDTVFSVVSTDGRVFVEKERMVGSVKFSFGFAVFWLLMLTVSALLFAALDWNISGKRKWKAFLRRMQKKIR